MVDTEGSESRKICLACNQHYSGSLTTCPQDGVHLVALVRAEKDPFVGQYLADRYEILEIIGYGGMGVVYKARQELIERLVAVKILKADLGADEQSVKRFQLEARALSRLNHSHVITVHDFGVAPSGQPYLVMEFLEGESLLDILRHGGNMHPSRALAIFIQVCSALEHAHRQNVIHRDLKPSNIILVAQGEDFVKVVDFGIAKMIALPGEESMRLTRTGDVFGSPLYMSPEQCLGSPLTGRSDIYSLGVSLYETLVGFPPFAGKNFTETMQMQVEMLPTPMRLAAPEHNIPAAVDSAVLKALEKKPERRYDSMLEMKEALDFALKCLAVDANTVAVSVQSEINPDAKVLGNRKGTRLIKASANMIPQYMQDQGEKKSLATNSYRIPVVVLIVFIVLVMLGVLGWYSRNSFFHNSEEYIRR